VSELSVDKICADECDVTVNLELDRAAA